VKIGLYALVFLALIGAIAPAALPTVASGEIVAENARWTALGVTVPSDGIVLSNPYAAPYTNHSFVVPFAWYQKFNDAMTARHDYPVDADALRADLPTLRLLIEKTYAGYDTAKTRGWNWNAWFAAWDKSLAARGNAVLTLRQAFAPWEQLEKTQPDERSGVPGLATLDSGSTSARLALRPIAACTSLQTAGGAARLVTHDAGQQPHAVQLWNGSTLSKAWYVSYPQVDGTARAISCGGRTIALTTVPPSADLSQTPAYQTLGDGIAYVRLPTFTDANNTALYAALTKAQGLGSEHVVIFDLRGNRGGSAPTDILADWVAQSQIEQSGGATQYTTQSCFHSALNFGQQQQLLRSLKPPASAQVTQYLQQAVDALKGPADCSVQPSVTPSDTGLQTHHFSGGSSTDGQPRLVALVDGGCRNECEYMVDLIAGLPGAVVVGCSTYGAIGFAQPGYFVLPHSRIPFRLALDRTDIYGDQRSVDGYGISADILLTTPQSQSAASLLALAKRL
jgi:hypothetical protein